MTTKKTPKKAVKKSRTRGRRDNGLRSFAIHISDSQGAAKIKALNVSRPQFAGFSEISTSRLTKLDPESAAQLYLNQALDSNDVPQFTAPELDGAASEFKSLGTESIPLTGTRIVKFRQYFHKIPVYGSLVTVELDEKNECLSINSALGTPSGVNPIAKVSPNDALEVAQKEAAFGKRLPEAAPRLHFYFDQSRGKWLLAYIIENVPIKDASETGTFLMDFVVDAHTGKLVTRLPRTVSMAAKLETAIDALGKRRRIYTDNDGNNAKIMRNKNLNVHTYDFNFRDPVREFGRLPGSYVKKKSNTWPPDGVSAHANAEEVAKFLRRTLKRANIDGQGGNMVSTVNCVYAEESRGGREWENAFWDPELRQMVYGQRFDDGQLLTLSANLDIVAHEMFHGVTDFTARLEYAAESGALNESYSDIFGAIISNAKRRNIADWEWELGEGRSDTVTPFRDMSDPSRFGQPKHMRNYQDLPVTSNDDWGGVHLNSGIHNFAAYKLITAKAANGKYIFKPSECATLFYLALTQRLSRTSGFSDSRIAVLQTAQTLFRKENPATREAKIRAIKNAFSAVGISN